MADATAVESTKSTPPMEYQKGILHRGTAKWAKVLAAKPCLVVFVCLFLMLLASMAGGSQLAMAEQGNYDWLVIDHPLVESADLLQSANDKADSIEGVSVSTRSEAFFIQSLNVIYENKDKKDEDILTPEKLQKMCQFEALFTQVPSYKDFCQLRTQCGDDCTVDHCLTLSLSIVTMFYTDIYCLAPFHGDFTNSSDCGMAPYLPDYVQPKVDYGCALLTPEVVDGRVAGILEALNTEGGRIMFGQFVSAETQEDGYTLRSKSILSLGGPLDGYQGLTDKVLEQQGKYEDFWNDFEKSVFAQFDREHLSLPVARSGYRGKFEDEDLNYIFFATGLFQKDFQSMMIGDFPIILLAMVFVFTWICIHTNSVLIGLIGISQIMLSIGVTIFCYNILLGVKYFSLMNILCTFLVMGIGADDIFVYVDAWKQSASVVSSSSCASTQEWLEKRSFYALARTRSAVFNTSFTTALAFFVTAITPIMPIQAFGIYAGVAIVINYLESLTFLPAFIIAWTRGGFEGTSCGEGCKVCGTCQQPCCKGAGMQEPPPVSKDGDKGEQVDIVGRVLTRFYVPLLKTPLLPALVILAMVATAVQGVIFGIQLEPPSEQEQFFSTDHVFTKAFGYPRGSWLGAADDDLVKLQFYIGIKRLDRKGYNLWLPNEKRGKPIYDDDFELHTSAARIAFIQTCDTIQAKECTLEVCKEGGFEKLVKPRDLTEPSRCWVRDFHEWRDERNAGIDLYPEDTASTDLDPDTFLADVIAFRNEKGAQQNTFAAAYKNNIGIIDGELKYATIEAVSTVKNFLTVPKYLNDWYVLINDFMDELDGNNPKALGKIKYSGGIFLTWYPTAQALITSLFRGFAICFPVVLLVLLFATNNFLIGFLATVNIAAIVACSMGFFKSALDYELGIGASVAGVMVIGFSVDYVVHISHMYTEGGQFFQTRFERIEYAVTKMGSTVFAGAITTAGAGLFMLGCQLMFFIQFAQMLSVTIFFSLLFSLGCMVCLLALMGPEGTRFNIRKEQGRQSTVDPSQVD